jgi:hypothetical protein
MNQLSLFEARLSKNGVGPKSNSFYDDPHDHETDEIIIRNTYINGLPIKAEKPNYKFSSKKIKWADNNGNRKELLCSTNLSKELIIQKDIKPVVSHKKMKATKSILKIGNKSDVQSNVKQSFVKESLLNNYTMSSFKSDYKDNFMNNEMSNERDKVDFRVEPRNNIRDTRNDKPNDRVSNDRVSNDRVSNDRISNDRVSNDRFTNERSNDKSINRINERLSANERNDIRNELRNEIRDINGRTDKKEVTRSYSLDTRDRNVDNLKSPTNNYAYNNDIDIEKITNRYISLEKKEEDRKTNSNNNIGIIKNNIPSGLTSPNNGLNKTYTSPAYNNYNNANGSTTKLGKTQDKNTFQNNYTSNIPTE